jgi:two-component system response regulator NreC
MTIRILLVDDHKITRDGLRAMFEKLPNTEVVGEAESGREAVKLTRELKPDVIIMDISMPDLNGIDATQQILAESPKIKVIALSMYSDRRYVIGMLKAGVSGYLLKSCAFDELANAVNAVVKNQSYISPQIADTVMQDYTRNRTIDDTSTVSALTPREREVLQLIAEGLTSTKIASRLFVSEKTVSTHRRQIMEKLNIYSVAELTKYALREGLTSLES